ncbi:MAG: hypothetical protein ACFFED_12355 [Candidatus Thorarchaeota archaeon]
MITLKFADEYLELSGTKVKLARLISRLSPAPLFNLYVGIVISVSSPIGLGPILTPISALLVCIIFMVILPIAPIVFEAWRGSVDLDVSDQSMRARFFLYAILFYSISSAFYWIFECHIMAVLSFAYITVTTGIMIVTHWTKVSVHCAGVGGPGTAIIIVYGFIGLLVIPIWLGVVWSRPILKQHTLLQSIGGLALAILITICTYFAFW